MKFPVITVRYNRTNNKSRTAPHLVYLRIYLKGTTDYVRMKNIPKILHKDWLGDAARGRYAKDFQINQKICDDLDEIRKWTNYEVMKGHALTIALIKDHIQGGPSTSETFNEWCHRFVKTINKNKGEHEKRAYRTVQAYKSYLKRLDQFNPHILFDEINPHLVESFDRYLAKTHNMLGVSRLKHFDKFKTCHKEACKMGLIEFDPLLFHDLKIKKEKSRRVSLSKQEIVLLRDADLPNPQDDFCRDVFVFECFTGLLYPDIQKIEWANVNEVTIKENGQRKTVRHLAGDRDKSEETFVIPLFKSAIAILDKYPKLENEDIHSPIFKNLVSSDKFRKRLNRIGKELGIEKPLGSKVARHSFAELLRSEGMNELKIASAMGHQDLDSQRTYTRQSVASALYGWTEPDLK